jgi:hypothetical protein
MLDKWTETSVEEGWVEYWVEYVKSFVPFWYNKQKKD